MRKLLLIFISFWFGVMLNAQQLPLYSNYGLNEYSLNPAKVGLDDFIIARFTYRSQWQGLNDAPETQVVSLSGKMKNNSFGIGGVLFNDQAGALKQTGITGSINSIHQLGKKSFLSFGVSLGYQNFRLDSRFEAEDEQDLTIINARNGEWKPIINTGLFFQANHFYASLSIPQVIEGELSFTPEKDFNKNSLQRHYYFNTGYNLPVTSKITLQPSLLFKYVDAAPLQVEISTRIMLQNKYWAGTSYRSKDAIVAMAGMRLKNNFDLSYAYDFTTSALNNYSNGSHEISLGYRFGGPKDSDKDGVKDKDDNCKYIPGPASNNGCPEEKLPEEFKDMDSDGIHDMIDDCPEVYGKIEWDGCPFVDSDEDSIHDKEDKCPNEFGLKELDGCPSNDRDKDGILDHVDECPDEFGLAKYGGCQYPDKDGDGIKDDIDDCPDIPGLPSDNGCPPSIDSDGDGVADVLDNCPNTAGAKSNNGCPIVTEKEKEIINIAARSIYFEPDVDEIRLYNFNGLNELVDLLKEKPDWKVSLAGHTDNTASEAYNLDLSRRRVEAISSYMLHRGITPQQVILEFHGETKPIASNSTEDGRAKNRRVVIEFVFE